MELKQLIKKIKLIKNKWNPIKINLKNKIQRNLNQKQKMKVRKIQNLVKIIKSKKEHKKNIASLFCFLI